MCDKMLYLKGFLAQTGLEMPTQTKLGYMSGIDGFDDANYPTSCTYVCIQLQYIAVYTRQLYIACSISQIDIPMELVEHLIGGVFQIHTLRYNVQCSLFICSIITTITHVLMKPQSNKYNQAFITMYCGSHTVLSTFTHIS